METSVLSSAEIISDNPDLLNQILIKLPTKPLLKLKCVSKHWLSLISDPNFCLGHTRHHQTNGILCPTALVLKWLHIYPSEYDVLPLKHETKVPFFDYLNDAPNTDVLQSCYGLFLCKSVINYRLSYFICNPTTKKFKELFVLTFAKKSLDFFLNMAFDPLKSPHYKVICVHRTAVEQLSNYTLDVYSSETDSWSLSVVSFTVNESIEFGNAVFCNGKIHWYSLPNDSLCFDVESERLEPLLMPELSMEKLLEISYFGECRGVLYIVMKYLDWSEMDVFEMASDYSHWTLKHRLYVGGIGKIFPELCSAGHWGAPKFSYVCITQSEKDEELKVLVSIYGKVICFDFVDRAWKYLYDLRPGVSERPWNEFRYRSLAYQYFENLSCV